MNSRRIPLVLLFGPSGVGKTTLAEHLADRLNWLHLDTDPYSQKVSVSSSLRTLAPAFSGRGDFAALAEELRHRVVSADATGAVVSFVSMAYLNPEQISAARLAGLSTIYLHGEENACLEAFLSREASTGRNLSVNYWRTYNVAIFQRLSEPALEPNIIQVFNGGRRRPLDELIAELQARNVA